MNRKDEEKLLEFKAYVRNIEYMKSTLNSLLYWDKLVNLPEEGLDYRNETMRFFTIETYKLTTSEELMEYIKYFEDKEDADDITRGMVRRLKRNYEFVKKIPSEDYKNYIILLNKTEEVWNIARERDDYKLLLPYLEEICCYFQSFANYWGYDENPYDAILGYYEPGMTVSKIDRVMEELRDETIELLKKIKESPVEIDQSIFKGDFKKELQEELSKDILEKIGFSFEAGRIDQGRESMTMASSNKDVRIITSYDETDLRKSLFTALREGGHGIYEQGIDSSLYGSYLAEPSSIGVYIGQSGLYGNMIGKSQEFWKFYYGRLLEFYPQLKLVGLEEFYRGINKVEPGLIRLEADELTYGLHIVIRYEIERDLINGKIQLEDLPRIWNKKYEDYLGLTPPNDSLGVMQDVHWFSGYWGYFPSYLLGNLYAAQFLGAMKLDIGDFNSRLEAGELEEIHLWLRENIHKYGSIYYPEELLLKVTGKKLSASYYIDYLKEKYYKIYNLK